MRERARTRRLDELTADGVAEFVSVLTSANYKRETIKKTRDALAMTLDFHKVEPNPARDKRIKLPKERKAHVPPPLGEHVERVAERLPESPAPAPARTCGDTGDAAALAA